MEIKKYRKMTETKNGKKCIQAEVTSGFVGGEKITCQEWRADKSGRGEWWIIKVEVKSFGKKYDYTLESGYISDHTDYQHDDFVVESFRKIVCQNVYDWKMIAEEKRD